MDRGIYISIVLAFIGILVSVVIWRVSTKAGEYQRDTASPGTILKKVDADAYERARQIYEGAISQLENEVDRLQQQLAAQQRDYERIHRENSAEILRLNSEVIKLHRKLIANGKSPADTDPNLGSAPA